jgi:hypothetical protein
MVPGLSPIAQFLAAKLLIPNSVALMQLRFSSLVVINLRRDLHP